MKANAHSISRAAALGFAAILLTPGLPVGSSASRAQLRHDPDGAQALPAGPPPAQVTLELVASRISTDAGARMTLVGMGRRWSINNQRTVLVVTFRLAGEDLLLGRVVDDQTGEVILVFDEGSLRALNVPPEE